MKPTECPAREREREKKKKQVKTAVSLLDKKNSLPLKETELPRIRLHRKILHFLLYKRGSSLS